MQLARADAGSVDAVLQPCYLDDVVSEALSPWHAEARRRGSRWRSRRSMRPGAPRRAADGAHAGVLLHNALHYTERRAHRSSREQRPRGHAILDVDDSGIGIPPRSANTYSSASFAARAARQRAPEGSLGLAIAQWIAHQHGARISVGEVCWGRAFA
ncbi:MAG: ATP-binding protein [Gemmatimonadetes bacterium]|nr:ATP-binding protein [Gemmatimonadota bacterium]